MKVDVLKCPAVMRFRAWFGALRARINPYKRIRRMEVLFKELQENLYYEMESPDVWRPQIMGLEETMRHVLEKKCSVSRYGDGEFELIDGRRMSFEEPNAEMQRKLVEALENPAPGCLCCVPGIFGSLARYSEENTLFWRRTALWTRPLLKRHVSRRGPGAGRDVQFGDALISRPYMGIVDKDVSRKVFGLWKELFAGRDILVVEGRFSRLGVGNDLLAGAKSVRRIWCPPLGAFAKYAEIKKAVEENANPGDLVLLALGATATILANDLARSGLWAVDAGHLDVEYAWMKMGAEKRVPVPGRYVNECSIDGREMKKLGGEEAANNVVAEIGT